MRKLKWIVLFSLLILQLGCQKACLRRSLAINGKPMSVATTDGISDIFGRLRKPYQVARSSYWRAVGDALRNLETLEGASYDPRYGILTLRGKPCSGNGPFHLDDLITALRAAFFEKESVGMTIDPDPENPHGPTMPVKYFGGCANTGFGWVLFECDRLMKSLGNGEDNLSHIALTPSIKDFHNMLQLGMGLNDSGKDEWNRFWLTTDVLEGPDWREKPQRSNGYQPVVFATEDQRSINFAHCRLYVRTEVMKLENGKLEKSPGKASKAAEYFANHINHYYDEYARLYPVFARAAALERLIVLAEWIEKTQIPMDLQFIRNYQPQVLVVTPSRTKAATVSLETSERISGGVQRRIMKSYGGVDLQPRTFFANDVKGAAGREYAIIQNSTAQHKSDITWDVQTTEGPSRVVALPTMDMVGPSPLAQSMRSEGIQREGFSSQPKKQQVQPDLQAIPQNKIEIAQSPRSEGIDREPMQAKNSEINKTQKIRGPPGRIEGQPDHQAIPRNGIEIAQSPRSEGIDREPMKAKKYESATNTPSRAPPGSSLQSPRSESIEREIAQLQFRTVKLRNQLPAILPLNPSLSPDVPVEINKHSISSLNDLDSVREQSTRGPPTSSKYVAADERAEGIAREPLNYKNISGIKTISGPVTEGFRPDSARMERIERESLDMSAANDSSQKNLPLGMPLFMTSAGEATYNIPRLFMHNSPRMKQSIGIEGKPNSKIEVPHSLMLMSEVGDIAITFQSPEIDQNRSEIYYPASNAGANDVIGYYPKDRTLEFKDGSHIQFDENGFPLEVNLKDSESGSSTVVKFYYDSKQQKEGLWPEPISCRVSSKSKRADAGNYRLVNTVKAKK
jgi:hypothetical protein